MRAGYLFASFEKTMDNFENLCNFYEKYVNKIDGMVEFEFQTLMKTIHGIFKDHHDKDPKATMIKTKDVLNFLIDAGIGNLFPNIRILYRIYVTIPVTIANTERSFSRANMIKS